MAEFKHEHRSVKPERYPASHLADSMSAHKAGLAARIRFQLERWIVRGLHYRLALAALLVTSVALLAGELVFLFAPGESGVSDAIWWAFLRLTDPGYLGDDEGLATRTISTAVTVLGYV